MTEEITTAVSRSGADEILTRILENARQAGQKLLDAADAKAEAILTEAAQQAEEARRKTTDAYAAKAEAAYHAAKSAAQLETRNRLLKERRRILDETMSNTVAHLQALPDGAYFDALLPLVVRSAQEGVLLFNGRDRKRVSAGFEAKLNELLEKGKSLTISDEVAPIDGGFLLKYDDIEMNGSFSALLEARREELEDLVNRIFFGDGER